MGTSSILIFIVFFMVLCSSVLYLYIKGLAKTSLSPLIQKILTAPLTLITSILLFYLAPNVMSFMGGGVFFLLLVYIGLFLIALYFVKK